MRNSRSSAFTLVEMLVVIAIIGVLMAMLLPAVGAIRENSRLSQCQQNMKQIGLAMYSYHNTYHSFPINYGGLSGNNSCSTFSNSINESPMSSGSGPGKSWIVGLLPFIDQNDLYQNVRFDKPLNFVDTSTSPSTRPNEIVAQTVLEILLCPSDRVDGGTRDDRQRNGNWAILNYNAVSGSNWVYTNLDDRLPNPLKDGYPYLKDYPDEAWLLYLSGRHAFEANGMDCGNGIINRGAYIPEETSIDNISDGVTNTLMVGEVIPMFHPKKWWYSFDGSTATCALPINFRPKQPNGISADPVYAEWKRACGFYSRHTGSANFLLADGSVRNMNEEIDLFLYRKLANFADGESDGIMPENN